MRRILSWAGLFCYSAFHWIFLLNKFTSFLRLWWDWGYYAEASECMCGCAFANRSMIFSAPIRSRSYSTHGDRLMVWWAGALILRRRAQFEFQCGKTSHKANSFNKHPHVWQWKNLLSGVNFWMRWYCDVLKGGFVTKLPHKDKSNSFAGWKVPDSSG